jgi:hypothetical protein
MNNTQNGSERNVMLDWIIIIAALVLFPKTADVMSYYTPSNMTGFVGWLYPYVSAALVEGALLVLHFTPSTRSHTPSKVVMWALVAISATAQVLDGFIVTGNEAQLGDGMKYALQFLMPLVPLIVLILVVIVGDAVPAGGRRVGLKHRLPNWNRIWHGDEDASTEVSLGSSPDANGQKPKLKVKKVR